MTERRRLKVGVAARSRIPALFLLVLSFAAAPAQTPDLGALEARAAAAAEANDYGGAAAILREARALFPENPRPAVLLGDLYTDRSLHALALDEYLAAESLDPTDTGTLQRIADSYGYLNREEDSIRYLRKILDLDPGSSRAVGDLGWMLFKTHRLKEGVELLEEAEGRLGPDIGFSMTLGTLRAELFEYEEARRRYEAAIAGARSEGYSRFVSVAYYNLSLLESRFRNWDRALAAADKSLAAEARSSGYLARGELRLRRMELDAALADFTSAFGVDTTPLARLGLAEAALASGRLDEALAWVREVEVLEEHPWMASFGTDPESFAMDLHELLWEIHRGRAELEKLRPKRDFRDALVSWVRYLARSLRALWHEGLFRRHARSVAASYAREGADLPAAAHAYQAFLWYPRKAARYLGMARALEEARVPGSRPSNDLEAARLARDPRAIREALAALDPVWERDLAEEGLGTLAEILSRRGGKAEARAVLERLWTLNPGALARRGFSVPAALVLDAAPEVPARTRRSLLRRLRALGLEPESPSDSRAAPGAFELRLRLDRSGAEFSLVQRASGSVLRRGSATFGSDYGAYEVAEFVFREVNSGR
ncbi:MAG: tetratricopeptide repeat protein [Treponema sp.]|nr:tetratricopeptide repeat protein [Treponema sp.]